MTSPVDAPPGWHVVDGKLHRELTFTDFAEAFAFMTRVAIRAEQLDHHPEWFNVYNRVEVLLTTPDADGVTELDLTMAGFMDEAAKAAGAKD